MRGSRPDRLTGHRRAWLMVLAANLPVPLFLGHICTRDYGRPGMYAGVGLVWLLGHEVCRYQPRLASVAIPGGWFVALIQFFPLLQIWAGALALEVATLHMTTDHMPTAGPLTASMATLFTAGILLVVAAVCGVLYRLVFPDEDRAGGLGKPKVDLDELA